MFQPSIICAIEATVADHRLPLFCSSFPPSCRSPAETDAHEKRDRLYKLGSVAQIQLQHLRGYAQSRGERFTSDTGAL